MKPSQLAHGPADVCASEGATEAAQVLDLRAGVPNVTCVREKEINRIASFPSRHQLRLAIFLCLTRTSAKWDTPPARRLAPWSPPAAIIGSRAHG